MPVALHSSSSIPPRPLRARIETADCDTFVIVVPTRRRIRHLMRELVHRMPAGVAPRIHLHTLETLATALFGILRPGMHPVSGVYQTLLYRRAVTGAGPAFRYFSLRKGAFPLHRGTFETITGVITRQKETGVTPEVLEEELQIAEPDEVHKLADVLSIYRAYDHILAEIGRTDTGGLYRTLSRECTREQFAGAFRRLFPAVDLIAIAGFDEFSEPEVGFLHKLLAIPGAAVDLTFDYHPGNPALFGHLEENYERFRALGLQERADRTATAWLDLLPPPAEAAAGRTALLARRLFAGPGEPLDLAEYVTLIRARDRSEEVRTVCRLIKRMALDQPGLDLSRICVAMHVPASYTDLFRRAFARYGIPANITDRFDLSRSPVVVTVLGLLQVATRGFLRDDVLRVAQSPWLFPAGDAVGNAHALAEISGMLRITGGYRTWLERIDRALAGSGPAGAGETDTGAMLRTARAEIERLHTLLRPLEGPLRPADFERGFVALLDRLQLLRSAVTAPAPEGADECEREVRALVGLLDVVADTAAALAATEGADAAQPLAWYLESLSAAVASQRYNVREQFGRGVLVTAIEETRGLPMDTMILVGLVDGEFPSLYRPEVFYSLARQSRRARRHAWEQRYLFYQAVTNWSRRLLLTWPEQEGDLELVPSTFLSAFLEAATVTRADAETLADPDEILSETDLCRAAVVAPERIDSSALPGRIRRTVEAVRRGAEVEWSRQRTHALPAFEGIIGRELRAAAAAILEGLRRRVFSVSQLESYGGCPYRFFGTRMLRLTPAADMREDLSPLEKGSLLHEILFTFMSERKRRGLPDLRRCSDEEAAEAERELLAVGAAALDRLDLPDPFWDTEREALLGGGEQAGILREYIRTERARTTSTEARFFETSFGLPLPEAPAGDTLSSPDPLIVGAVRLRGRVDRIEIGEGLFTVIDYKTGRAGGGLEAIREGTSLQLPLYLRAMEQLLHDRLGLRAVPAAGLHYILGREVKLVPVLASDERRGAAFEPDSRSQQIVGTDDELRALIDDSVASAEEYVAGMAEGRFPLTDPGRVAKLCRSCELNTMCRIQSRHHLERGGEDEA